MSETVVFDTSSDPIGGDIPVDGSNPADSFTNLSAGYISDVSVVLSESIANDPGVLTVSLFSDSGAEASLQDTYPYSLLATLGTIGNSSILVSSTSLTYDVPVTHQYELAPNTRYWIELTETSGSQARAAFTSTDTLYPTEFTSVNYGVDNPPTTLVLPDNSPLGPLLLKVSATACFAEGTLLATDGGEIPVQDLKEGSLICVANGQRFLPLRWVGRRNVRCQLHPLPKSVWPIRISPGAFELGIPDRPVFLSPDHAVFVADKRHEGGGFLVPIRYLVNGSSIMQVPVDEITYYHIELDFHAIVFASRLSVESYLDTGNRSMFENNDSVEEMGADHALAIWRCFSCAPLVVSGPDLLKTRSFLIKRAEAIGFRLTYDADVHLLVDGERVDAVKEESKYVFNIRSNARTVLLMSRCAVNSEVYPESDDHRTLGVLLQSILAGQQELLPQSGFGWHPREKDGQWSCGEAVIHCRGESRLEITVALTSRYWEGIVPLQRTSVRDFPDDFRFTG